MKAKDELVPLCVQVPLVALERIRQEARRRKVSIKKIVTEVVNAMAASNYPYTGRDLRLQKFGFSYNNVDWDDEAQGCGVLIAEYVMQHLPPSRRELQ